MLRVFSMGGEEEQSVSSIKLLYDGMHKRSWKNSRDILTLFKKQF